MTKIKETPPVSGCQNCSCRRGPRCHCHAPNVLLALWDYSRLLRRRKNRN